MAHRGPHFGDARNLYVAPYVSRFTTLYLLLYFIGVSLRNSPLHSTYMLPSNFCRLCCTFGSSRDAPRLGCSTHSLSYYVACQPHTIQQCPTLLAHQHKPPEPHSGARELRALSRLCRSSAKPTRKAYEARRYTVWLTLQLQILVLFVVASVALHCSIILFFSLLTTHSTVFTR